MSATARVSHWPRWNISAVTSDARASDLDADFPPTVGSEGIYRRADTLSPPPLDHVRTFADWLAHLPSVRAAATT